MSDHIYYTGETNFGTSGLYDNQISKHNGDNLPGHFGQNPSFHQTRWPRPVSEKPKGGKRKRKEDKHGANRLDDPLRETAGHFPMQSNEVQGGQRKGRSSWDMDSITDEDNSNSPSYGIGRLFSKYADRCSMNGVPYIKTSKSYIVKFAWSCLLLIAVAAMSYHLYRLISTFLDYKKQAQVQLSFSSLQFPAVTFCNVNPLRMSQRDLASDELNSFIDSVHPNAIIERLQYWEPNYDTIDNYYEEDDDDDENEEKRRRRKRQTTTTSGSSSQSASIRSGNFLDEVDVQINDTRQWQETIDEYYDENDADSWEAESTTSAFYEVEQTFREIFVWEPSRTRARMGHQISDMLLQCSFAGGRCLARNFTRLLTSNYGNCYTIQYSKFISRRSGPKDGLELKLFLETDEYVPGIANSKGIQVVIHDQGTLPFPDDEGIAVKAGSETRIGLKKVQISRLGKPYDDCTPIEDFQKQYGVKYTRTTCQNVCQQRRTLRSCGCYDILSQETLTLLKASRNKTACESSTEIKCALRISQQFQSDNTECGCHSPCSESSFQKIVSSREWPDSEFATLLAATVCKNNYSACNDLTSKNTESLRSEFIKLVIYYEDLNFEDLEENADYEIDQFLSDVGGTVGLWIGLSILSMFEIFNLITDIVLYLCCGRYKGNSSKNRYKERSEQK